MSRENTYAETIVLGAGFTGLTAAAMLKKNGIGFLVLEREDEVGGTWRDTKYPGCGSDTEIPYYFPSFAKVKTKGLFGTRQEIFDHLKDFSQRLVGRENIRFGVDVKSLNYNSSRKIWEIKTSKGTFEGRFVIHATIGISTPKKLNFEGMSEFKGKILHSTELSSDVEVYRNKKVAIIGMGATTAQIIPAIYKVTESLTVFARTLPYVRQVRPGTCPDPKNRVRYAIASLKSAMRYQIYTFFENRTKIEFLIRWPFRFWYYALGKMPKQAIPPFAQPLNCTRVCMDWFGLTNSLQDSKVKVVRLADQGRLAFYDGGLKLKDERYQADIVIAAIGYESGRINYPFYVDNVIVPFDFSKGVIRKWNSVHLYPNSFFPLMGGPLTSVPPRQTEITMPVFIKTYKYMEAKGLKEFRVRTNVKFDLKSFQKFKRNSVLYSPHCGSLRYFNQFCATPDEKGNYIESPQAKEQGKPTTSGTSRFTYYMQILLKFKVTDFDYT